MDRTWGVGVPATTTFLFTDLVGSTELIDRLGDDVAHAVRRVHFGLLRRAVALLGGREVKNLGDGLMVAFSSTLDAVACAVAMQQAVRRHNDANASADPLRVRIGIHAGEPVREAADFFGSVVVVAKRLCDHAAGGQILVSQVVRALVGSRDGHVFRDADDLAVKGLAEPVPAAVVVWEHAGDDGARPPHDPRREPSPDGRAASLRGIVESWLTGVSGDCIRLLTAAAAVGAEFEVATLEEVAGVPEMTLLARLEEAVDAGLVRELAAGRFGFSREIVRRILVELMTATRRAAIERRVAGRHAPAKSVVGHVVDMPPRRSPVAVRPSRVTTSATDAPAATCS